MTRAAWSWLATAVAACSAPAPPPDLTRAERFEKQGDDAEALGAYELAIVSCHDVEDRAMRDRWCRAALLGRAETLERLGRVDDAARAYEAIPTPRALVNAARLHLDAGRDRRAYDLYWKTIVEHPDDAAADEALRHVVRDGRARNARQLYDALTQLRTALGGTQVDDNLLYDLALIARDDLGDAAAALAHFDAYAKSFPEGTLFDESLWQGAALARATGDVEGAIARYDRLLATRESAFLIGSYHSVYLDDAQLEKGRLLRDSLNDPRAAVSAFGALLKHYPQSILRDDALWERAATRAQMGDDARACADLRRLKQQHADSKYELERAPELRERLGCDRD